MDSIKNYKGFKFREMESKGSTLQTSVHLSIRVLGGCTNLIMITCTAARVQLILLYSFLSNCKKNEDERITIYPKELQREHFSFYHSFAP